MSAKIKPPACLVRTPPPRNGVTGAHTAPSGFRAHTRREWQSWQGRTEATCTLAEGSVGATSFPRILSQGFCKPSGTCPCDACTTALVTQQGLKGLFAKANVPEFQNERHDQSGKQNENHTHGIYQVFFQNKVQPQFHYIHGNYHLLMLMLV